MNARGIDFTGLAYLAALAALGYGVYRIAKAGPDVAAKVGDAVTTALNAINPANKDNIIARGVEAVGQTATGNPSWNLGARAWEFFHPRQVAAEKRALATYAATADQEDADMGAAMRQRAFDTAQWTTADQEDAELGQAMLDNSRGAVLTAGGAYMGVNR